MEQMSMMCFKTVGTVRESISLIDMPFCKYNFCRVCFVYILNNRVGKFG